MPDRQVIADTSHHDQPARPSEPNLSLKGRLLIVVFALMAYGAFLGSCLCAVGLLLRRTG
jgi:hypothetical protein